MWIVVKFELSFVIKTNILVYRMRKCEYNKGKDSRIFVFLCYVI